MEVVLIILGICYIGLFDVVGILLRVARIQS